MARNEEKRYGRLNRLYLFKEKEEYEKANPKRPRLDTLDTAEEVQKWLPSIKNDLNFYLKKSQVTCYSDAHIEECREKVIKLEREFKAFVRKIKQLSPSPLEVIPWTDRPYKRKKSNSSVESSSKEFKRIVAPILDNEIPVFKGITSQCDVDCNIMNQPLCFSPALNKYDQIAKEREAISDSLSCLCEGNCDCTQQCLSETRTINIEKSDEHKTSQPEKCCTIVNYDSSDSEDL